MRMRTHRKHTYITISHKSPPARCLDEEKHNILMKKAAAVAHLFFLHISNKHMMTKQGIKNIECVCACICCLMCANESRVGLGWCLVYVIRSFYTNEGGRWVGNHSNTIKDKYTSNFVFHFWTYRVLDLNSMHSIQTVCVSKDFYDSGFIHT